MQKHPQLKVEKRSVFGNKLKKLRKDDILPANVYGKGVPSTAVQMPVKDFQSVYTEVGETGLVDLMIGEEKRPVLIHSVHIEPISRNVLHADFYQVNLKEKVKTMVPLVIIGQAQAVTDKAGLVMQPITEVEVEALPESLPENIEVNIEHLALVDDQVTVGDIKAPQGVTILTDSGQVVVKIAELASKEAQEEAAAEVAAAQAAKAAEAPEGEAPAATDEAKPGESEKQAEDPQEKV
ncbi:MAG: 50S ribosomal protein L25 [Patescibacteria group bacterium]